MPPTREQTAAGAQITSNYALKVGAVCAVAAAMALVAALLPPFAQDPAFHDFADQGAFFRIPHFGNVMSNAAYAVVAALGLGVVFRGDTVFATPIERWPYVVFFVGVALIAAGSAYYHANPTNRTLVWDRLPMTVAFTALLSAFIMDRIHVRLGICVFLPLLVAVGAASVLHWHLSETAGQGDLRFYYLVQASPIVIVPLITALFPGFHTIGRYVVYTVLLYGVALGLELLDKEVFALTGRMVSGHTLKHIVSAAAIYMVAAMLREARSALSGGARRAPAPLAKTGA